MRRSERLATRIYHLVTMADAVYAIEPHPKDDCERYFTVEFEGHLYRVTITRETEK